MSEGELKKQLKELVETSAEINLQFAIMDGKLTHEQANIFEHKIEIKNAYLDRILEVAKKEIFNAIEQHIMELVDFWKSKSDPQKQKMAQYYIDAYLCIKHNILEEDKFKLKKYFGENNRRV